MSLKSNALAMLTGTVLAQALPVLAAPLLARLYSPEAFGLQTLFMGIAASLSVIATCRMDLAIVLPESDDEVSSIAGFILCSTFIVAALTWVAVPILKVTTGRALPATWLWLLPLMVSLIALFQMSVGLASRRRQFHRIARATVSNQGGYVAMALTVGLAGVGTQGMVLSKVFGQTLGMLLLWRTAGVHILTTLSHLSLAKVCATARKYRQFLVFNTPYSLLGSVARDAPIYIFSAVAAMEAAGFFGLARTVLLAPTLLISNAFSQVFYREALALRGGLRLQELTLMLLRSGLAALAPLFAFCTIWGDIVFAAVFGENWRGAGTFSMVLGPTAWMAVQTGWPGRLFEVNMRQGVSFFVQLSSDAVTAAAFIAAYVITGKAFVAVATFAICNIVYHHVYLLALFHVSRFPQPMLVRALGMGWLTFLGCLALQAMLRHQFGALGPTAWIAALAFASIGAIVMGGHLVRKSQGKREDTE